MDLLEPRAGEELERQLARYARVRLDPSPAATRRARGALMAEAWRRRLGAGSPDVAAHAAAVRAQSHAPFASWPARRLGGALAAAVLAGLVIGSTAFAASRAGGPLYELRLTIEAATLPSDAAARLEAELAHAQTRLAEATEAAARGDEGALTAALVAYEDVILDLEATTGGPADRALEAVQFHRTVLLGLLETAPPQALAALHHALERSGAAIEVLDRAGTPGGPNAGNGAGNGNQGNGAGKPATQPTTKPTPKPARTPKPDATPRPGRTAAPATPAPTRAPKPERTANPNAGNQGQGAEDGSAGEP